MRERAERSGGFAVAAVAAVVDVAGDADDFADDVDDVLGFVYFFGGLVRFICSFRFFACSGRRDRDDGYLARCVRRTGDLSCWPLCPLALPAAQAGHDVEQTWLIEEKTRAGMSF